MWKPTVFLFLLMCLQFRTLANQDASGIPMPSEPNITQQSTVSGQDANGTIADPNATQQPQQPVVNDRNMADAKTSTTVQNVPTKTTEKEPFEWTKFFGVPGAVLAIVTIASLLNRARTRSAKIYKKGLRKRLGQIQLISPDIPGLPINLLDAFVSLRISEATTEQSHEDPKKQPTRQMKQVGCKPQEIIQKAFTQNRRMLLILGDAGSGKTTMLSYYAMCCLGWRRRYRALGYSRKPLPIYFPLREVQFADNGYPVSLAENMAKLSESGISKETFYKWLNGPRTLVLLDGLDEISDKEERRRICQWIDETATDFEKVRFIVTCRWTGYGRKVGVVLGSRHLCAEMREFSPEQQEEFLMKWFCAAYLKDTRDPSTGRRQWRAEQKQLGLNKAREVITFLNEPENKRLLELARIPMLLQIMAIIWKDRESLPRQKAELFEAALKYMLEYKPRQKHFKPLMNGEDALEVLRPVSLRMQEELSTEEAEREWFHKEIRAKIKAINDSLTPELFCRNLVNRAAVIAECGKKAYIFRHKSFREYLAGVELAKVPADSKHLSTLVEHFGEDWWEEPLRFFIAKADDRLFDGFMDTLFKSDISNDLDQKQQNLLEVLAREARMIEVDSMVRLLNDPVVSETKKRYILNCLKAIDREKARRAVSEFAAKTKEAAGVAGTYAQEIASEVSVEALQPPKVEKPTTIIEERVKTFRNRYEYNAEYILIPGGRYKYQGKTEMDVPSIYFAKYPVTNKRYRRFIHYLQGSEPALAGILPKPEFDSRMAAIIYEIEGLSDYMGNNPNNWHGKLCSEYDTEKRFDGADQPVVGVSWFAARAYCCWLSLLETTHSDLPVDKVANLYRLPREIEWEWAASGGKREYPWGDKKPSDKLANYTQNVGATTPVGRFPDGATPDGLMDMAGNVWEWMENKYKETGTARSLRGGSWLNYVDYLRCSYRNADDPGYRHDHIGFRVVRSQS